MTAPIIAAKAGSDAAKALTGDIYTRRWQTKPRKKGQAPVEHELRVNPVGLGLGAVTVGAAALLGAAAAWAAGIKVTPVRNDKGKLRLDVDAGKAPTASSVLPEKPTVEGFAKAAFLGPIGALYNWLNR